MSITKRAIAEGLGTGWLVLGGCGSAVISAAFPQLGIGILGVAIAFGLTVVTMAMYLVLSRDAISTRQSAWAYGLGNVSKPGTNFHISSRK